MKIPEPHAHHFPDPQRPTVRCWLIICTTPCMYLAPLSCLPYRNAKTHLPSHLPFRSFSKEIRTCVAQIFKPTMVEKQNKSKRASVPRYCTPPTHSSRHLQHLTSTWLARHRSGSSRWPWCSAPTRSASPSPAGCAAVWPGTGGRRPGWRPQGQTS